MHSIARPIGAGEHEPLEHEVSGPSHRTTPSEQASPADEQSLESAGAQPSGHGDLNYLRPDPEPSLSGTPSAEDGPKAHASASQASSASASQKHYSAGETVEITKKNGESVTGTAMSRIGRNHYVNVNGQRTKVPDADVKEVNVSKSAAPTQASTGSNFRGEFNNGAETHAWHYGDGAGPKSSEYIVKGGKIDITSHGLGTGVYGVKENTPSNGTMKPFRVGLEKPFELQDPEHGEQFKSMSKNLQGTAQKIQASGLSPEEYFKKHPADTKQLAGQVQGVFDKGGRKITPDKAESVVKDTLTHFHGRYNAQNDKTLVRQPINKLMKNLGYPSLSTGKAGLDGFQNGNVVFDTKGITKAKFGREGTEQRKGNAPALTTSDDA